jgi:hypothetical protein
MSALPLCRRRDLAGDFSAAEKGSARHGRVNPASFRHAKFEAFCSVFDLSTRGALAMRLPDGSVAF